LQRLHEKAHLSPPKDEEALHRSPRSFLAFSRHRHRNPCLGARREAFSAKEKRKRDDEQRTNNLD